MRFCAFLGLCLAATAALPAADPVADCRAAHADDLPAYAACLEAALRAAHGDAAGQGKDTPAATATAPSGLGAEQVTQAENRDETVQIRIVSTAYNSRGLGTFHTEDGQVWQETTQSPERRHLDPDKQYTARIERSKVGGYRLYVDGVRWMKTVERIK